MTNMISFTVLLAAVPHTSLYMTSQALPLSRHLLIPVPILLHGLPPNHPREPPCVLANPSPSTSVSSVKGKVTLLCISGPTYHRAVHIDVRRSTHPAGFKTVLPDRKMVHGSVYQVPDPCLICVRSKQFNEAESSLTC
jgi:hypothetical protein